ncbi:hypothetical protein KAX02_13350 [candidate division WOR-3 bacterium]|nr:hypothetical protein [candidate division WOR-3 bacterium]
MIAATKYVGNDEIDDCIDAGIKVIGGNRVQDAEQKKALVKKDVEWHMIGHLQTNKVNKSLKIFSMIQSIDSLHVSELYIKITY